MNLYNYDTILFIVCAEHTWVLTTVAVPSTCTCSTVYLSKDNTIVTCENCRGRGYGMILLVHPFLLAKSVHAECVHIHAQYFELCVNEPRYTLIFFVFVTVS